MSVITVKIDLKNLFSVITLYNYSNCRDEIEKIALALGEKKNPPKERKIPTTSPQMQLNFTHKKKKNTATWQSL